MQASLGETYACTEVKFVAWKCSATQHKESTHIESIYIVATTQGLKPTAYSGLKVVAWAV